MSYRPPTKHPRGRWARWLHEMRQTHDWSQTQAFENLRAGLKLGPKSRASYIRLDMGERPPRPGEAQFLVEYFGRSPDEIPAIPGEDRDPLVAALERQTEQLEALVAELRLTRAEQLVTQEQMQEALRLADGLSREGTGPRPRPRPVKER